MNEKENVNVNETKTFTAKVMSVLASDKFSNKRMSFVIDTNVTQIKEGKEVETNIISFQSGQVGQCETNIDLISLADSLAMGGAVNRQIYSLLCKGATITFERVFVPKGSTALDGTTTSEDRWSTRLKSIKNVISPVVAQFAMQLIQNKLLEEEPQSVAPTLAELPTL